MTLLSHTSQRRGPGPARSLYTARQSRAIDACAIAEHGLPGPLLMARAARAAFARMLEVEPHPELVQVFCGPGNNGGDGLLVACLAADRGISVRVFLIDGEPRSDDARAAAAKARHRGLELADFDEAAVEERGLFVDAMLGTGISGELRPAYAKAVACLNRLHGPVFALDVPSGLDADTGHVHGEAVRADWTISFIAAKRGLFTARGPDHAGQRFLDDLAVPAQAFEAAGSACELLSLEEELSALGQREAASHKGSFGRCLLIGGDHGMGGAIILAAQAALRTGVGLAAAATRSAHLAPMLARLPECMVRGVDHRNELDDLLPWADAIVIGPGLGRQPWGEQMLQAALTAQRPLLLDADALNLLEGECRQLGPQCVITPHPGEAARLLGVHGADVQADRFASATELARHTGAVVVLKGNGSIIARDDALYLCDAGNPGMASGGMGDVLSGVIGGLLAQGLAPLAAARLGTLLHATAGDRAAARVGQRALLASDLSVELGALLR